MIVIGLSVVLYVQQFVWYVNNFTSFVITYVVSNPRSISNHLSILGIFLGQILFFFVLLFFEIVINVKLFDWFPIPLILYFNK